MVVVGEEDGILCRNIGKVGVGECVRISLGSVR